MSLNEEDRNTLMQLYISRADRTLADADWLLSESRYELAAGRYYYACFYALQALFLRDGITCKTHKGVQQIFFRDYVKTGKVNMEHGAWLSRMERLRELADYNCAYVISQEEVEQMRQPAHEIILLVKTLLLL